tara:strand:- start:197 stop:313 length:117 start_codon:yes stop_codon:yes gene_type:complete
MVIIILRVVVAAQELMELMLQVLILTVLIHMVEQEEMV